MKVNQLSEGFPQYLSHRQIQQNLAQQQAHPIRRIEQNQKRNKHENIFSDQYHFLPSSQVKNPFLRQEFKIGEVKKNWIQLVEEKALPPIEVYDCVLDQVQTVPRETIFMKNKDLYPKYYQEALNEEGKIQFRRVSGVFMQQISEINKMKPIIEQLKTPTRSRIQQNSKFDYFSNNGSNNNFTSRVDISSDDKQQKSYSYQSRPSLLKQNMLIEKSNFFTPNFKVDDDLAEEKRNLYLNHDPKYINQIEHTINKELIQDSMKQKSKSMIRLQKDLKGQFELKQQQQQQSIQFDSTPSQNSLEKLNELKRSVEFQQFEDELTKFEKSLKQKKKNQCVWMNNSNSKFINKSQFMQQSQQQQFQQQLSQQNYFQSSQSAQNSPVIQLKTNLSQSSVISSKKQQSENNQSEPFNNSKTEIINTPSFSNLYNFNFKPMYPQSQVKIDSPIETQDNLVYS